MPMIDFAEVRRLISLSDVLNLLGIRPACRGGPRAYGPCPLRCAASDALPPGSRYRQRCCSYDLDRGFWRCHRCGHGGNQLDLYAQVYGITTYNAAMRLCAALLTSTPWKEG